jgi:hypothetical protein
MNKPGIAQCAKAVTLFRGLYARVARYVGVDVSYLSRVANGKRKSRVAEKALTKEFKKAVAVMRSSMSGRSGKKDHVVVTLHCLRCKTPQRIHIAASPGVRQISGEMVPCISCENRIKVKIPNRIIRGPFPV